jgi:hydroxysqualene dehydroxylase
MVCPRAAGSAAVTAPIVVVGAGLAGLSAALWLQSYGQAVVVLEAAPFAGGRCRSFVDAGSGRVLDNGTHMLLSGNRDALAYVDQLGTRAGLTTLPAAALPFASGVLPLSFAALLQHGRGVLDWTTIAQIFALPFTKHLGTQPGPGQAVIRAALNAAPGTGSAALLRRCLRETLLRGDAAMRPMLANRPLGDVFVAPAVARLDVRCGRRVVELRDHAVHLGDGTHMAAGAIILAVPPEAAAALLPGLMVPAGASPIVNIHYMPEGSPTLPGGWPLLGMEDGPADWLFVRDGLVSATLSAADAWVRWPAQRLATTVWQQVSPWLRMGSAPLPPFRVIKERRATFAQTPANAARRAGPRSPRPGVFVAGDWTDTGLPASIESAVRSGQRAAVMAREFRA